MNRSPGVKRLLLTAVAIATLGTAGALAVAIPGSSPALAASSPPLRTPHDGTGSSGIADPGVVRATVGGIDRFVSVSTGGKGKISVWTSVASNTTTADPVGPWRLYSTVALKAPSWVNTTKDIWAPDEIKIPSGPEAGKWALFYAAQAKSPNKRCIGLAVGSTAVGPFTPQGSAPFICPSVSGAADKVPNAPHSDAGVIDPTVRLLTNDSGAEGLYVTYKTTNDKGTSSIQMVQLSVAKSTVRIAGTSHKLTQYAGNQENPVLVKRPNGTYTLFTSQGDYQTCKGYTTVYRQSKHLWSGWPAKATALDIPGAECGKGDADITANTSGAPGTQIFFSGHYKAGLTLAQANTKLQKSASSVPFHLYVGKITWTGNKPTVTLQ